MYFSPLTTFPPTTLVLGVSEWNILIRMPVLYMVVLPRLVRITVSFPDSYRFHILNGATYAAPSLLASNG